MRKNEFFSTPKEMSNEVGNFVGKQYHNLRFPHVITSGRPAFINQTLAQVTLPYNDPSQSYSVTSTYAYQNLPSDHRASVRQRLYDTYRKGESLTEQTQIHGGIAIMEVHEGGYVDRTPPDLTTPEHTATVPLTESAWRDTMLDFKREPVPQYVIALTPAALLKTEVLILIAWGENKLEALKRLLHPSAWIHSHPCYMVIAPQELETPLKEMFSIV